MSLALGIAIYFIIWWTVLFAVLPIGVRTQGEDGNIVPGTPESAPARPRFLLVVALTSAVSGVLFALVYIVVAWGIVDLEMVPFGPGPAPTNRPKIKEQGVGLAPRHLQSHRSPQELAFLPITLATCSTAPAPYQN